MSIWLDQIPQIARGRLGPIGEDDFGVPGGHDGPPGHKAPGRRRSQTNIKQTSAALRYLLDRAAAS